jgi:superfamily II DNA or RNA helicase
MLQVRTIASAVIDSTIDSVSRQKILSRWGIDYQVLLSIHTLEIGYDVPEVGIEIILASTSNMNQIIQRIGRIVRKYEGKKKALIYVIYASETKDDDILELIRCAVESGTRTAQIAEANVSGKKGLATEYEDSFLKENKGEEKRRKRAYNILELNAIEPMVILEPLQHQSVICDQKLFHIRSNMQKDKYYQVNSEAKTCSCPDFKFNKIRCKHIIATELISCHQS